MHYLRTPNTGITGAASAVPVGVVRGIGSKRPVRKQTTPLSFAAPFTTNRLFA